MGYNKSGKYSNSKKYDNNRKQKYNRFSMDMQQPVFKYVPQRVALDNDELPAPAMRVEGLYKLADFLDSQKPERDYPEIKVLPGVLRSVGNFVNERKRMKYSNQEFGKKIAFLSEGIEKQYQFELKNLQYNTEIRLAQLGSNLQQEMYGLARYYDTELQRIVSHYKIKKEEMELYYKHLELERQEQARRFDKMIKISAVARKRAVKAISEAEQVCRFYQQKIYAGTASREEKNYYMQLLRLRIDGINGIVNIIPQIASKIK